jgi:hypothetical protein
MSRLQQATGLLTLPLPALPAPIESRKCWRSCQSSTHPAPHNPQQPRQPDSQADTVSSIWFPTTYSDLNHFWPDAYPMVGDNTAPTTPDRPTESTGSRTPVRTYADMDALDQDAYPSSAAPLPTTPHQQGNCPHSPLPSPRALDSGDPIPPAAAPRQPRPHLYHLRAVSDAQLRRLLPDYDLYFEAKILKDILVTHAANPSSSSSSCPGVLSSGEVCPCWSYPDGTEFPYVLRRTGKVVMLTLSSCSWWEDEEYDLRWRHRTQCKCGWDPDADDYWCEMAEEEEEEEDDTGEKEEDKGEEEDDEVKEKVVNSIGHFDSPGQPRSSRAPSISSSVPSPQTPRYSPGYSGESESSPTGPASPWSPPGSRRSPQLFLSPTPGRPPQARGLLPSLMPRDREPSRFSLGSPLDPL